MTSQLIALPALATPKDVAEYLQVPMKTLSHWRSVSSGPRYIRVGRMIRYRSEDVEAYLSASEVETKAR